MLLLPVAVVVALVGLVLLICLGVLFTPVFILLILPFLVVAKCRYNQCCASRMIYSGFESLEFRIQILHMVFKHIWK